MSTKSFLKTAVILGFLFLLVGSFYDNSRGPLYARLITDLNLNLQTVGYALVLGHVGGLTASLLTLAALRRYDEYQIIVMFLLLSFLTSLGSFFIEEINGFLIWSFFIGCLVSSFNSLCNLFVFANLPPKMRTSGLLALHSMYGFGSLLASATVGVFAKYALPWQNQFFFTLTLSPCLIFLTFYAKKNSKIRGPETSIEHPSQRGLDGLQILILSLFALYVAAEVICSMWMSRYLTDVHGLSTADASFYVSGFFFVMLLTRLIGFFPIPAKWDRPALWGSLAFLVLGTIIGLSGHFWGFILCGLVGPFFPIFIARASTTYPHRWKALNVWMSVSIQLVLGTVHLGVGSVAEKLGLEIAYPSLIFMVVVVGILLKFYFHHEAIRLARITP